MTMDPIFYQPGDIALIPEISQLDRISRLTALGAEDTVAGLLWLAMNFPAVCDAMLDKTEFDAVDDEDPCQEPEPFCAECGASIGIFLRYGTNWRHYLGDVTTTGQIEMFDPGHHPVIACAFPAYLPSKLTTRPASWLAGRAGGRPRSGTHSAGHSPRHARRR